MMDLVLIRLFICWLSTFVMNAVFAPSSQTAERHRYYETSNAVLPGPFELACSAIISIGAGAELRVVSASLVDVRRVPTGTVVLLPASTLIGYFHDSPHLLLTKIGDVKVCLGTRATTELCNAQVKRVKGFAVHKNFIYGRPENDVAVMVLANATIMTPTVQTCSFAVGHATVSMPFTMPAYGRNAGGISHLLKVHVAVVPHSMCSGTQNYVPSKMLCLEEVTIAGETANVATGTPLIDAQNCIYGMLTSPYEQLTNGVIQALDIPRKKCWIEMAAGIMHVLPAGSIYEISDDVMSKYDLTWRLADFLDPHLIIPLFEFLADRKMYDIKEVLRVRSEFLRRTSMVDELIDTHIILKEPVPPELYERRAAVIESRTNMQNQIGPIVKILEQDEVSEQISNSRERDGRQLLDFLVKKCDFHPDMLDMLYKFAQLQYDCGDYAASSEYLYFYRLLVPQHHSNYLSALWGKVASTILQQHWDTAREDLLRLKAYIDNNPFETELELLHQRAWFIHWGLFVYFNSKKGLDEIVETFLNPNSTAYLSPVQTLCPHILRYLAAAVIINKKKKQCLKELVRIIQLESYHYRDPVTEFVECLYVHYNFDGAQQKLRECEEVLANDFFLVACLNEFIDSARLLIFEMYCRIHQCISIKNIAEKLNMTPEESEKWIVNLIRNARLDAKIDAKLGLVVMGTKAVSVYEQVMESTKLLSFRAQSIAFQIDKLYSDKQIHAWSIRGY